MTSGNETFLNNRAKLAKLAIRFGVNLQQDQELIITAPITALEFVRELTEQAYQAGAKLVTAIYSDDEDILARYNSAPDASFDYAPAWLFSGIADAYNNGAARLAVAGATPSLLENQDKEKIARANKAQSAAAKPMIKAITTLATNWSIVPFASPGWAKQVFPDLSEDDAIAALWDQIFTVTRSDLDDPVAAWEAHVETLQTRLAAIQDMDLWGLHFHDGETDVTIGLAEHHVWQGGTVNSQTGIEFEPNLPTEEIFSMPHKDRVNGKVVFTKPVALMGSIVDGLVVEFKDGKAISVKADKGQDIFQKFVETDEGSSFLGEVALVPHSSPISQSGVLFFNTLFDENAACHIAFGQSYTMNMAEGFDGDSHGANNSNVHMDCMIGNGNMSVDGIKQDKSVVPIMRNGEFV